MGLIDRKYMDRNRQSDNFNFNEKKGEIEHSEDLKNFHESVKKKRRTDFQNQRQGSFSFVPWIIAIAVLLIVGKAIQKSNNNDNPELSAQPPILIEQPQSVELPQTIVLSNTFDINTSTCPLTLIASDKHHFVKLFDRMRGDRAVAEYFVRAGEELKTTVPAGQYKIKFGAGNDWQGKDELFGRYGNYGESGTLEFTYNGLQSIGHTISFYKTTDGNLHTKDIGRDAVLQN